MKILFFQNNFTEQPANLPGVEILPCSSHQLEGGRFLGGVIPVPDPSLGKVEKRGASAGVHQELPERHQPRGAVGSFNQRVAGSGCPFSAL